jgi:hypothetical protein
MYAEQLITVSNPCSLLSLNYTSKTRDDLHKTHCMLAFLAMFLLAHRICFVVKGMLL